MGSTIFAMPVASIAMLFSFAFGITSALPWAGPQETKVYRAEEFSPKPTELPAEAAQLVKRDWVPVNVCGWIAGRPESIAGCGPESFCIHDTMHQVLGCCATAGPCTDGVFTTCVDNGMAGWESTQGLINNGVLSCKASSTCFQNQQGNYKQYNCGKSNVGGDIQTTYSGQATDMKLQIVYTGVTFSPMTKPVFAVAPTEDVGGSKDNKDGPTSYIAGGTIGGVALTAILIAGIILYLRRRRIRNGQRVGGFVSLHREKKPPTPSALKRLTARYSAAPNHDFVALSRPSTAQEVAYMSSRTDETTYISPLTGHPDESHAPYSKHEIEQRMDRDLLSSPLPGSPSNGALSEAYDTAIAVPISRLNVRASNSAFSKRSDSPSLQLLPKDEDQGQLLVGLSADDFGHDWDSNLPLGYGGVSRHKGTHIHSGDMPETTDMGLVSTLRRAASQLVSGNARSTDFNARSESMRPHSSVLGGVHENPFEDEIWSMHPTTKRDNLSVGLGIGNANTTSRASSSSRTFVSSDKESEHRVPQGVENPSVEQMLEAFNAATRAGGEPRVVKKDFPRLIDDGIDNGSQIVGVEMGLGRGSSTAGLLRKPVSESLLHKRGRSEGGIL